MGAQEQWLKLKEYEESTFELVLVETTIVLINMVPWECEWCVLAKICYRKGKLI